MKKTMAALFSSVALGTALYAIVKGIGDPCWAYGTVAVILTYWSV